MFLLLSLIVLEAPWAVIYLFRKCNLLLINCRTTFEANVSVYWVFLVSFILRMLGYLGVVMVDRYVQPDISGYPVVYRLTCMSG